MEAEIATYLKTIKGRDERIAKLINTIEKALKIMKYPRLMQLIHRELSFDRFEYTWEEKLAEVKKQIDLTAKEEAEINEAGIILCPKTLKEFYDHIRDAERKTKNASEKIDLKQLRDRNTMCEGARLNHEKWISRQ